MSAMRDFAVVRRSDFYASDFALKFTAHPNVDQGTTRPLGVVNQDTMATYQKIGVVCLDQPPKTILFTFVDA